MEPYSATDRKGKRTHLVFSSMNLQHKLKTQTYGDVHVSVAPHPEMLHSAPSAKGSLGKQAAFTN